MSNLPILKSQPKEYNFLSPFGYKMVLKRAPGVSFFLTNVVLPSITSTPAMMPTPFKNLPFTPDKLEFSHVTFDFKVDEFLYNYLEIYDWLKEMAFPESYDQHKKGLESGLMYSDMSIFILDSSMQPRIECIFENAFPITLSEMNLTSQDDDVNFISCQTEFKYSKYSVSRI